MQASDEEHSMPDYWSLSTLDVGPLLVTGNALEPIVTKVLVWADMRFTSQRNEHGM